MTDTPAPRSHQSPTHYHRPTTGLAPCSLPRQRRRATATLERLTHQHKSRRRRAQVQELRRRLRRPEL